MQQHVPRIIQDLTPYLDHYGYLGVFGSILLEDFGLPLPGETILITGAFLSALGHFNIVWIMLLAFFGAVIGDNTGYAIGYFGGRKVVLKYGRFVMLTGKRLSRAEDFFNRHGGKIVTIARFINGLRQLNGIIAGVVRMKWWHFLAFNTLGAALWVGAWGSVGYFFGNKLDLILTTFKRFQLYFIGGAVLMVVLITAYHLFTRRKKRAE